MRNKRIYILGFAFATLIVGGLFFSNSERYKTKVEVKIEKKRIVFLAHIEENPYWQIVKSGAEDAAKERGCILEYKGPQDASAKESMRLMDMSIASKPDGIITHVTDETDFNPLINKAMEKRTPVITVDTDAIHSKRIAYVGMDNYNAGQIAGAALIKKAGFEGTVGIIMGGFTTKNQMERVNGFEEYLKANSNLKIISTKSSNSYLLEAELMAGKILKENPFINSLYCTSSLDGIGAARAVLEVGRQGNVTIVCFDDLPETLSYLKNDVIYCAIVQKPYDMGYMGVNLMMDILEGREVKGEHIIEEVVVTKENMNTYNLPKRSRRD